MLGFDRDGDRYAGEYSLDKVTGEIRGCPGRATSIQTLVQSIKTRDKSKGASATRNHSDAITLEELKVLMDWSSTECPDELLTVDASEIGDLESFKHRMEHGFMRAFMSSGFTLWTRVLINIMNIIWTDKVSNIDASSSWASRLVILKKIAMGRLLITYRISSFTLPTGRDGRKKRATMDQELVRQFHA